MNMRSLGIATIMSVIATVSAPAMPPASGQPMVTAKSTQAFADCFINDQNRRAAAWAFVPNAKGGVFSNLGAHSVAKPYFVRISDRGEHREIRIEDAAPESAAVRGVDQCI
jgi:hypothetical protein